MIHDDHNPSASAPARAPSRDLAEDVPPPVVEPADFLPENPPVTAPAPPPGATIPEDLNVPWGWLEIGLFLILGVIGSVVTTGILVAVAVAIFGGHANDFTGPSMTTAKSIVLLLSQALLDGCAILYLYLMLRARTQEQFWHAIGWRKLHTDTGVVRASAFQFMGGGAVLASVVAFVGNFLTSKSSLPIEEILKARVSVLLFATLGVLVAPVVEETIFRGFLYPVIARSFGVEAGILVTGILFGLMHAAQLWGGWGQIALLVMVGIVLTWVRARTGTVTASFFVHLGYNGIQLLGFLIYTMSTAKH